MKAKYFKKIRLAFGFLANTAPEGVQVSTDIASYLSFVMALFTRLYQGMHERYLLPLCLSTQAQVLDPL